MWLSSDIAFFRCFCSDRGENICFASVPRTPARLDPENIMSRRCHRRLLASLTLTTIAIACGGMPTVTDNQLTSTGGSSGAFGYGDLGGADASQGGTPDIFDSSGAAAGAPATDTGVAGTSNPATVPNASCGNSTLDANEGCDDGNKVSGDGCDGTCKVEYGYLCTTPGTLCTSTLFCGDGLSGPDEGCDDANKVSGDGCSSTCQIEPGYTCGKWGTACTPTQTTTTPVCGNGLREAGETCDDGGVISGDGCSAACQTESGYSCDGTVCTKIDTCGNGVLNSDEQCDDGNRMPGDCCSAACRLESHCACTTPAAGSSSPGQICKSTIVCGDGSVTGDEVCDDSNTASGDGCASNCRSIEAGYTCPATGGACSVAAVTCPNAKIDPGEGCDDGNGTAGDGCATNCQIEAGYVCPTAGAACKVKEYCGDGKVAYNLGETCDDGNAVDTDGCTSKCTVAANYSCDNSVSPSVCQAEYCGNSRLTLGETCDDGNKLASDGCSDTCQREDGYSCPKVGTTCRPICGDAKKRGTEECDDGDTDDGDGCNSVCRVEPGYACTTASTSTPSICVASVCGNAVPEPGESCDDGNNIAGDGCGPTCQKEPTITRVDGVPLVQESCGDGLITGTEACDDGNTTAGDGCSATCTIEAGYKCDNTRLQLPASVDFRVTFRDFMAHSSTGGHPDFEWAVASTPRDLPGAACTTANTSTCGRLDADGKPTLNTSATYTNSINSAATFSLWYRDTNPNHVLDAAGTTDIGIYVLPKTLTLTQLAAGSQSYVSANATSNAFFPLDGQGFGNETYTDGSVSHNFHFTSELRYFFQYRGGETLLFSGDDDVWVFINGRLAVDIGGRHALLHGRVVLGDDGIPSGTDSDCSVHEGTSTPTLDCTGYTSDEIADSTDSRFGLTKGKLYEIVLFHAERHTTQSNFKLTLSGFLAPRSYCTPSCGDGVVTATEECDDGTAKNNGAYGGCTAQCKLGPYCGDNVKNGTEVCDNGINVDVYGVATGCTPDCKATPYCGDGKADTTYGETCDQSSANSATAYGANLCTNTCTAAPFCGDGVQSSAHGEACDDGQNNGGPTSSCDQSCAVKCGNGKLDAGEQCDDGTAKNTGAYGACNAQCKKAPYCGDGVKQAEYGEACDDGLNDGSYGTCTSTCKLASYCGDGALDAAAGEKCDNGPANLVSAYGPGLCTTTCQVAPYCGDHIVNGTEACDDGANNSNTVAGACKLDCSGYNAPPATCGNGIKDSGEQCDDGSAINGSALSLCDGRCQLKCGNGIKDSGEQCDNGVNDGTYGTCNHDCTLTAYCGDGVKDSSEQCDLGAANSASTTLYGPNLCTTSCTLAPYCGDSRVNGTEQCDGQSGCTATCTYGNILL
jgi:fibro-slime domain-containing protein